ncbi:MAG: vitamin K epoxide reductase family protein [Candidatus Sungbacteria bacterium]|nr:vitamin K epoxide reductase family protein [Candidatus Sungbacteria bacterium]
MLNSNNLSPKLSPAVLKRLAVIFLILGSLGFLDALYLSVSYISGVPPSCFITSSCDVVTTSEYAAIWGIPVAMLGVFYYFTVSLLALLTLDTKNEKFLSGLSWFTLLGFLASLWFVYVQFFILKALCIYCLLSALISTLLFILGVYVIYLFRRKVA